MGHSSSNNKPLGLIDALAGAVVFLLLCWGMYSLLSVAVPGLLKYSTLTQIIASGLLFLAVWGFFGNSLFKAYFDVLQHREDQTLGAEKKASELKSETNSLQAQIDEEIRQARLVGLRKRDDLIEQAKLKAQQITDQARASAEKKYQAASLELEEMQVKALAQVETEAVELAKLVKDRALASDAVSKTVH